MKILAIWDRRRVAPKSRLTLVLTTDNQLLEITPDTKYTGEDKDGNSLFEDTGDYSIAAAFGEEDKFDFTKANGFAYHFGFTLVKRFKKIQRRKNENRKTNSGKL